MSNGDRKYYQHEQCALFKGFNSRFIYMGGLGIGWGTSKLVTLIQSINCYDYLQNR